VIISKSKDGLFRQEIQLETRNPKDPTINVLIDPGANCNIIQEAFFKELSLKPEVMVTLTKRRLTFANCSNSSVCQQVRLKFSITKESISREFETDFLVCNISEVAIIGRPFLDESGLMHLLITSETSPDPFECNQVKVEHLAFNEDEEDEINEADASNPKPFDETTQDIWEEFAKQFDINSEMLFKLIDFAATKLQFKFPKYFIR